MTPLRLIQVGVGGWGRDWAKLLVREAGLAQVVAYVDLLPDMLVQLQSDVGITAETCFPSLEAALERTDAEAVLVTTSLGSHAAVARAALAAGKHVLVEKPFVPSVSEAQQLVDEADAAGRVLMVSQNYRFFPGAQAAATLVREGVLGVPHAVSIQFRKYANTAPRGNHRHYTLHHPLLLDMAIHHFDLMRFVLGQEPELVQCHAWNPPGSNFDEPAAASATIAFDGGTVVSYYGNWVSTATPTLWSGAWQIECAEGVIAWTGRGDGSSDADVATLQRRGKRPRRLELPKLAHIDRAGSLAAFYAAIRDGAEPSPSGRENIGSLALTFAAIEAANTGETRRLKEVAV